MNVKSNSTQKKLKTLFLTSIKGDIKRRLKPWCVEDFLEPLWPKQYIIIEGWLMQSLRMKSQDAKKIPNWNILVTILNLKFWIQYSRMPSDCIQP